MTLDEAHRRIAKVAESGSTRLALDGLGLTALPDAVRELTRLDYIDVGENQLADLPGWVTELTSLTGINLSDNRFVEIPLVLRDLIQLEALSIGECKVSNVPQWIGELRCLQSFHIGDNRLTSLPVEICDLAELRYLGGYRNRLSTGAENGDAGHNAQVRSKRGQSRHRKSPATGNGLPGFAGPAR